MSFGKAKIQRFNDIKPCAPGPTAYNVAVKSKAKSSVASHPDRIDPMSPSISETGSAHSVPCRFRTPTLPKRKKTTTSAVKAKLFAENNNSEALREKIVECENKDTFIKDLTEEIEELKDKISDLDKQKAQLDEHKCNAEIYILNLKNEHVNEVKKLTEKFEKEIYTVNEEKLKVKDDILLVRKQYEELKKANMKEIIELKNNCDKFNVLYDKSIEECKKLIEEKNMLLTNKEHELKALEDNCIEIQRKHAIEVEKLKKEHQIEIQDIEFEILKTMTELQKEKEQTSNKLREIDNLMKTTVADLQRKFEEEKNYLLLEYEDKTRQVAEQTRESAENQMKEKLEEMESNWKKKLEVQQKQSDAILKECQTISEYNIIQCEVEKKEIETKLIEKTKALDDYMSKYNEIVSKYDDLKKKYRELQHHFSSTVNELKKSNDTLIGALQNKSIELKKHLEENRTYLITIKNSQNTIEVLKKRLINSDRDVEQLKKELTDNEAKLLEYENKCLQLTSDLKQAQDYNEELEMQHESAIKINTNEIQQLKTELLEKVDGYRSKVEKLAKKLSQSEDVQREIMQQLRDAHEVIEKSKMEFDCFETINSQIEFEVEQSQNELEDYRIREMDWNNLKEKLEHTIKELESLIQLKQDEGNDFKNHIAQLQDKCELYFQHQEYYKSKAAEYEIELDETGNILKNYIEQSGKYDELLQKFEQLEKENIENRREILKLSTNCQEKNSFIEKCETYDELLKKYEQLEKENSWNKKKAEEQPLLKDRLDQVEQENETLLGKVAYLEEELKEVSDKYAELVGHHNNKQKIKHLVDLKIKNEELIQANMDWEVKMQSQIKAMEKLKKENADLKKRVRRTKLHPDDKENIASPNRSLNSSRVESPFRERN